MNLSLQTRLAIFPLLFCAVFFASFFKAAELNAKPKLYGTCYKEYVQWKRKGGWKAFYLSSNGRMCGLAWGQPSKKVATRLALRECRKRGKRCKLYSVRAGSRKARKARSRIATKPEGSCAKMYGKWKTLDKYRSFYLSPDGTCYSRRAGTLKAVLDKEEVCYKPKTCRLYAFGAPERIAKGWQEDLATMKLYSGKIDGILGRNSINGLNKFSDLAGIDRDVTDRTFLLLKWAARLKSEKAFSTKRAATLAHIALEKNSTDVLLTREFIYTEDEKVSGPNSVPEQAPRPSQRLEKRGKASLVFAKSSEESENPGVCVLRNEKIEFRQAYVGNSEWLVVLKQKGLYDPARKKHKQAMISFGVGLPVPLKVSRNSAFGNVVLKREMPDLLERAAKEQGFNILIEDAPSIDLLGVDHSVEIAKFQKCVGATKKPEKKLVAPASAGNVLKDGSFFVGDMANNVPHGQGVLRRPNGSVLTGRFHNGKPHGKGIELEVSGGRYEGNFHNGLRHGRGTYYTSTGKKYVGNWKDNRPNGITLVD